MKKSLGTIKSLFTLLLGVALFSFHVCAMEINSSTTHYFNDTIVANYNLSFNYVSCYENITNTSSFTCFTLTNQSIVPLTTLYQGTHTTLTTLNLSFDGSCFTANDSLSSKACLSNTNKTFSVSHEKTTNGFVFLRVKSNFEKEDSMNVSTPEGQTYHTIYRDSLIAVPFTSNYSLPQLSTLYYSIGNYTGNLTVTSYQNKSISGAIYRETLKTTAGQKVIEKVLITSDAPVSQALGVCSLNTTATPSINGKEVIFESIPQEYGTYVCDYKVKDMLGNIYSVSSTMDVLPSDTYYFRNVNIPSIKTGEEVKLKFYDGTPKTLNFTIKSIEYVITEPPPTNASDAPPQLSPEEYAYIRFTDADSNSYYPQKYKELLVSRSPLYLSLRLAKEGNIRIVIQVQHDKSMKSNGEFTITARTGNYSVFENQSINVNGRVTECDAEAGVDGELMRHCHVLFPLSENMDNDLVILTRQDYNAYEEGHKNELNLQQSKNDAVIKKLKEWRNIFIVCFIITFIIMFYVWYPWDWLVYPDNVR